MNWNIDLTFIKNVKYHKLEKSNCNLNHFGHRKIFSDQNVQQIFFETFSGCVKIMYTLKREKNEA